IMARAQSTSGANLACQQYAMWPDTVGLAGLSTDRSGHATPTSTIVIVSGSQTRLRGAEFHQWTSYRRLKRLRMWSFQNGTGGCCRKTVGVTTNKRSGAHPGDTDSGYLRRALPVSATCHQTAVF